VVSSPSFDAYQGFTRFKPGVLDTSDTRTGKLAL
jgi:hypothetical protein